MKKMKFMPSTTSPPTDEAAPKSDSLKQEDLETEIEELKPSYIERALSKYIYDMIFKGFEILKSPQYRGYFFFTMIVVIGTLVCGVLNRVGILIDLPLLQAILFWGILSSAALIIGGILGGLMQKALNFWVVSCIIVSLISAWFFTGYASHFIVQIVKLGMFLTWAAISAISFYYIILYFHTSMSYRVVSMGNSTNRLFFQPILQLGAWGGFALSLYLFTRGTIDAQFVALCGMITSWLLLLYLYRVPKLQRKSDNVAKDQHNANMMFRQVLGFYNLVTLYHIYLSYEKGTAIGNIIIELIFLSINTLNIINGLAKKVENIKDLDSEKHNRFRFQRTSTVFMKLKQSIGSKSMIIIALGIALGYHCVMLESYLGINTPILTFVQSWLGAEMSISVFSHRVILLISLSVILISMLLFKVSPDWREMYINRYTARHALGMFGNMFRTGDDGTPSIVQEVGESIKSSVKSFGEKMREKMKENPWLNVKKKTTSSNANKNEQPK